MIPQHSAVVVRVEQCCLPEMWQVIISTADQRFRPVDKIGFPCRVEGRAIFWGPRAEEDANEAAKQIGFALKPLENCIPVDDVDSLIRGISREVGAMQLSSSPANTDFAGVVRSYLRDGSWKSLHMRMSMAEEMARRLGDENKSLRAELALLKQEGSVKR